jgi:hypothetical protein
MSAFGSKVNVHEGSWLMAELSVLAFKCRDTLKEIVVNQDSIRLYKKKDDNWEPVIVHLPDSYLLKGLVDIELACAMLYCNLDNPLNPSTPSADDIRRFQLAHSELAWRILLGPRLNRQPQWVVVNQAGEYYMWMKNVYGEDRILATCTPNTSKLQTSFYGIISLGLVDGVYSWELTKHEALTAIDLLLPHNEETGTMSLIVNNPEFCDRFSGITIGLLEVENHPVEGEEENDALKSKSPKVDLKTRPKRSHTLESVFAAIDAKKAEERDDEADESESRDKFAIKDDDDFQLSRRLTIKVDEEDAELVDEILSGQAQEDGWPLIGYAQFSILGSWVEIGNVILSIEKTLQENEKGSHDIIFISRLVLTCVSSGARILTTVISHTISMMQRETSVRWLSPNDIGLTNIVIVDFETEANASTLCNTIANILSVKPVAQYAMLPTGRLKEHSQSEIPKSDPVTILTSGTGTGSTSKPPSKRATLLKSASNRIIALNITVRSFRHALEVARERKGLMTLARACGMASRTERMLEDGDFAEARKLVLRSSEARRNSDAVEHVKGLSMDELHLEPTPFAHGGSGKIFKGVLGGEKIVAKCMIDSDMSSNKQLLNEVRILSSLTHVNIIRYN